MYFCKNARLCQDDVSMTGGVQEARLYDRQTTEARIEDNKDITSG